MIEDKIEALSLYKIFTMSKDEFEIPADKISNEVFTFNFSKEKDKIKFNVTDYVRPPLYYYKDENVWCLSTSLKQVLVYLEKKVIPIEFTKSFLEEDAEEQLAYRRKMIDSFPLYIAKNLKQILWYSDCEVSLEEGLTVLDYKNNMFSVELESEKGYEQLLDWIKYVDSFFARNKDNYLPTLTAGCDTRILTYFARKHGINTYANMPVKPKTNHTYDGDIAKIIADRIGAKLVDMNGVKTSLFYGFGSEPYRESAFLADKDFYYTCFCKTFMLKHFLPFMRREFIRIEPKQIGLIHTILLKKLCPDLLDIPFHSLKGQPQYKFEDLPVKEAERIIKLWGWK